MVILMVIPNFLKWLFTGKDSWIPAFAGMTFSSS